MFLFKNLILILGFIFTLTSLSAQQDSTLQFNRYFGIDANFVNVFIPLDNNIGFSAPYLFNFRKYDSEKRFFRQGLNIDIDGSITTGDTKINRNSFFVDYRMGSGKNIYNYKRFQMVTGWDVRARIRFERTSVGNSATNINGKNSQTETELLIGTGPFVGLEFKINERMSLYTDAHYYVQAAYSRSKFEIDNQPSENNTENVISYSDWKHFPTQIILFYKF